jgi:hypothetical protein
LVFSDIATSTLPLRAFFPTQEKIDDYLSKYLQATQSEYTDSIDQRIAGINSLIPDPSPLSKSPKAPTTPSPKTLKRSRSRISSGPSAINDENHPENEFGHSPRAKEAKAVKHAKLLQVMRDVERSLGTMEMHEREMGNGVF